MEMWKVEVFGRFRTWVRIRFRKASEAAKLTGVPNNFVIRTNTILMQNLKIKIKINAK